MCHSWSFSVISLFGNNSIVLSSIFVLFILNSALLHWLGLFLDLVNLVVPVLIDKAKEMKSLLLLLLLLSELLQHVLLVLRLRPLVALRVESLRDLLLSELDALVLEKLLVLSQIALWVDELDGVFLGHRDWAIEVLNGDSASLLLALHFADALLFLHVLSSLLFELDNSVVQLCHFIYYIKLLDE